MRNINIGSFYFSFFFPLNFNFVIILSESSYTLFLVAIRNINYSDNYKIDTKKLKPEGQSCVAG